MARREGGNLAFLIGAVLIPVARGWSVRENAVHADSTAAGDPVMHRTNIRKDHTIDFRALLEVAAPYVLPGDVVGTEVAWAAELIAADANGLKSGTGLVDEFNIDTPYDGMVEITGRIICSGTALTTDLSPAT